MFVIHGMNMMMLDKWPFLFLNPFVWFEILCDVFACPELYTETSIVYSWLYIATWDAHLY